jgi:hypothetical protein
MIINDKNSFGYSELYEFDNNVLSYINSTGLSLGRFVEFSNDDPSKIMFCKNPENYIGVTSINPAFISNNPKEWHKKYGIDDYGRIIYDNLIKAKLINIEETDGTTEEVISTYKDNSIHISNEFNSRKEYVERLNRISWVPVTLLGKCIVQDNGFCKPGDYCTIYSSDDLNYCGTVEPARITDTVKFKVLNRLSKNSIIIFIK